MSRSVLGHGMTRAKTAELRLKSAKSSTFGIANHMQTSLNISLGFSLGFRV